MSNALIFAIAGVGALATSAAGIPITRSNSDPVPTCEGVIVISLLGPNLRNSPARRFTPDGKELGPFALGSAAEPLIPGGVRGCTLFGARLSPDGKRLAAFRSGRDYMPIAAVASPSELWVFDFEDKKGPLAALKQNIRYPSLAWNADGTRVYGSGMDPEKVKPLANGELAATVGWVYDFQHQTTTKLALPAGHEIVDVSPDEKFLLTRTRPWREWEKETPHIVALDTLHSRRLTTQPFKAMRISPDGKQVIGYRAGGWKDESPVLPGALVVASVADGAERTIALPANALMAPIACWSPDGKRIAYMVVEPEVDPPNTEKKKRFAEGMRLNPRVMRVAVADSDGNRAKTIFQGESRQVILEIDWR